MSPLQGTALGAEGVSEDNAGEAEGGLGSAVELQPSFQGSLAEGPVLRLGERRGRPHMVNTDACVTGSGDEFSLGTMFVSLIFFAEHSWLPEVFLGTGAKHRLPRQLG